MTDKKVLLIHGQSHFGTTCHMGRELAAMITKPSGIQEIFLPRDLNHFCKGCFGCIEDEKKCPYWSEKEPIMKAMEESDILIFTTPNYCNGPSSPMKAFLDLFFDIWMIHKPKPWMFTKTAIVLCASAGAPCHGPLKEVKHCLRFWGIPHIYTYGLAVQAMNWDMVTDQIRDRITAHLKAIAKRVNYSHSAISQHMLFSFMRSLHRRGWDSSPSEKQYWQDMGWLDRKRPWQNG